MAWLSHLMEVMQEMEEEIEDAKDVGKRNNSDIFSSCYINYEHKCIILSKC